MWVCEIKNGSLISSVSGTGCGGSYVNHQPGDNVGCHILVVSNIHCTFAQQPLLRREVLACTKAASERAASAREARESTSGPRPTLPTRNPASFFQKVRTLRTYLGWFQPRELPTRARNRTADQCRFLSCASVVVLNRKWRHRSCWLCNRGKRTCSGRLN